MWRSQEMEMFERLKNKWEEDTKIYIEEIGWEDVEWTRLAQDRYQCWALENVVQNIRVP